MAEPKNKKTRDYIFAVGRRKEAVARARLYKSNFDAVLWGETKIKKGDILVNQKPIGEYFSGIAVDSLYLEPIRTTNNIGKYAFTIKVVGGGKSGQLDAVIHSIARVLEKTDPEKHRSLLKKKGFLTRDSRIRERRKVGTGGKARRQKQSPKR